MAPKGSLTNSLGSFGSFGSSDSSASSFFFLNCFLLQSLDKQNANYNHITYINTNIQNSHSPRLITGIADTYKKSRIKKNRVNK